MIRETIVTTLNADGTVHIAPMGVKRFDSHYEIAPFKPSTTLENLERDNCAVINFTDDVRIFAGCLTGRYDWPVVPAARIRGRRLQAALSHVEIEVESCEEDKLRPRFRCREVYRETHAPFTGFNRARAAVLEAAILVSRLHMLPAEKIDTEIAYLQIAVNKTAGEEEREAWGWLMEKIRTFREQQVKSEGTA